MNFYVFQKVLLHFNKAGNQCEQSIQHFQFQIPSYHKVYQLISLCGLDQCPDIHRETVHVGPTTNKPLNSSC